MENQKLLTTAKTAKNQRGRPFPKGKSGNPAGRPQGSRNKATIAALELLDGEAEKLTGKAVEMALGGDAKALKLCIDRLIPPRRERPVVLELPPILNTEDLPKFTAALIAAVGRGEITPGEATALSSLVTVHVRSLEIREFEKRLAVLETTQNEKGGD